jgi:hypothetical protein
VEHPDHGFNKLNVDPRFCENLNRGSYGAVLRDWNGHVMPSKSVGETSEAIACMQSLNLAHGLDFEVWSLQTISR